MILRRKAILSFWTQINLLLIMLICSTCSFIAGVKLGRDRELDKAHDAMLDRALHEMQSEKVAVEPETLPEPEAVKPVESEIEPLDVTDPLNPPLPEAGVDDGEGMLALIPAGIQRRTRK